MACVTVERVTQLMREAAEQHHAYEEVLKAHMVEAGQLEPNVSWTDPEWPMWYARYVVTQLAIDAEKATKYPVSNEAAYGASLRLDQV